MDRVLITGGLGFLGSHLTEALLDTSEIYIIDEGKNNERLKDVMDKITVTSISLTDDKLKETVKDINPDTVFHLGAFTLPFRNKDFIQTSMESNIHGTVNLLRSLENVDLKNFVYTSSSEVYGSENKAPFHENMVPRPTSPYSVSKLAGEYYALLYHDTYGLPTTVLRLFNIYGPYQTPNRLIPELIKCCLERKTFYTTKGEQSREFNFVKDIVNAIILATKTKNSNGQVINVGCGKGLTIKNTVSMILNLMNNPISAEETLPYRENEIWQMHSDSTKALKILGWKPKYSIEDGLKETINWYNEQWQKNKGSISFRGV